MNGKLIFLNFARLISLNAASALMECRIVALKSNSVSIQYLSTIQT